MFILSSTVCPFERRGEEGGRGGGEGKEGGRGREEGGGRRGAHLNDCPTSKNCRDPAPARMCRIRWRYASEANSARRFCNLGTALAFLIAGGKQWGRKGGI